MYDSQLHCINAERCLLSSLPETFTYLDHLEVFMKQGHAIGSITLGEICMISFCLMQVLELPNNRFTKFPIELHLMKGLKTLNLANNALTLLPRKINVMTNLQNLNLSR